MRGLSPVDEAELRRLRWRCRRGMKELDQLLNRWLDQQWAASSEAQRGVFLQLLDCEDDRLWRSEERTSELQSLMRISYAVFCLKKKKKTNRQVNTEHKNRRQTN